MAFSAEDQRDILESAGVLATVPVDGADPAELYVVANLDEQTQLVGGEVFQQPRHALAAAADVAEWSLTGHQDTGTVITIDGAIYRITAIESRRDGFVTLWLGDYVEE